MKNRVNLESIDKDIKRILTGYLSVNSETNTTGEKKVKEFLMGYFSSLEYFHTRKKQYGSYPIPDDPLKRAVCWGLVKGEGNETVVLLHHSDVVGVEDFKTLKDYAFQPYELEKQLLKIADDLQQEAKEDLLSGEYLFGRGSADMKGGGAIQLALLKRYSEVPDLKGNLIVLALPDEENLSAGMRAAVDLLAELSSEFGLRYVYTFNSEPHQRKSKETGVLSEGTVGKMLSFVYVRGSLSHVGKVFEGLNPVAVLSEIVANTELSLELSDIRNGESAPPPTWLYQRDRKERYDVSMPLGAGGCISILTLDSEPTAVMNKLLKIAKDSFDTVVDRTNEKYQSFCRNTGRRYEVLPWKPSVMTYAEVFEEAKGIHGDRFIQAYKNKVGEIGKSIQNNELSLIEGSFLLIEFIYDFTSDLSPRIVIGFVPPYYPNVSNLLIDDLEEYIRSLAQNLSDFCSQKYGQRYDREYYYTGISDLSYVALKDSNAIHQELNTNMPLFGEVYNIPLQRIEELSMPCMNIGPWGKDFHKLTERVLKEDLFNRTPDLLNQAIEIVLGHNEYLFSRSNNQN